MKHEATRASRAAEGIRTNPGWLDVVLGQVGSLRFGSVQIVVHDRRVVQVDRTERFRFDSPIGGVFSLSPGENRRINNQGGSTEYPSSTHPQELE